MRRAIATAALGLAGLSAVFNCVAGSGSRTFGVDIILNTSAASSGVCISETLSEQNGAIVRVTCNPGHFVSISPIPGGPFVGTHGGAYSYLFGSTLRGVNIAGYGEFAYGAGTTASYRVFGVTEVDGRLDLLISF